MPVESQKPGGNLPRTSPDTKGIQVGDHIMDLLQYARFVALTNPQEATALVRNRMQSPDVTLPYSAAEMRLKFVTIDDKIERFAAIEAASYAKRLATVNPELVGDFFEFISAIPDPMTQITYRIHQTYDTLPVQAAARELLTFHARGFAYDPVVVGKAVGILKLSINTNDIDTLLIAHAQHDIATIEALWNQYASPTADDLPKMIKIANLLGEDQRKQVLDHILTLYPPENTTVYHAYTAVQYMVQLGCLDDITRYNIPTRAYIDSDNDANAIMDYARAIAPLYPDNALAVVASLDDFYTRQHEAVKSRKPQTFLYEEELQQWNQLRAIEDNHMIRMAAIISCLPPRAEYALHRSTLITTLIDQIKSRWDMLTPITIFLDTIESLLIDLPLCNLEEAKKVVSQKLDKQLRDLLKKRKSLLLNGQDITRLDNILDRVAFVLHRQALVGKTSSLPDPRIVEED